MVQDLRNNWSENLETTLLDMENITRNPLTRESADTFIRYLNSYPSLNEDFRTQELIETFTRQLESIQAAWAQEKISALSEFRNTRSAFAGNIVSAWTPPSEDQEEETNLETHATLSKSEYTKLAQDVIQFTPESEIKNNRNIFLFQKYFAQTDLGSEISVDGVGGPQTLAAISYDSRATSIFLRELGFKGLDGGTLNIRNTFTADITAAIQSAFWVRITSQVETPEVAVTPRVEVAPAVQRTLAEEIIGVPLTAEKIRAYQVEHNIGADGILGNETYFEMRAGELVVGLTGNIENLETQEALLQVLQYWNPAGINYAKLLPEIGHFREQEKNNAQYAAFFRKLDAIMQNPASNPHTPALEEQATRPNSAGGSLLWDIPKLIEGEITPQEYLQRNKGTWILIGIAAFIFFGDKIPGIDKIPGMWSWFGRIAWLFGGAVLWGGDLLKYGLEKAGEGIGVGREWLVDQANQTWSSPEERIRASRNAEGSPLQRIFPEADFFDAVQAKFREDETLGYIRISDIPSLIASIESGTNIPAYIENLRINGQALTKEQLIGYLSSLKKAATWKEITYISDLYSIDENYGTLGSIALGTLAVTALIAGAPVIATLWAVWAAGAYMGNDYINTLVESLTSSKENIEISNIIATIWDPELAGRISTLYQSDASLEEKIQQLWIFANENASYTESIKKIIDNLIALDTKFIEMIVENRSINLVLEETIRLSATEISGMKGEIQNKISYIEAHVWDDTLKQELIQRLSLVADKIEALLATRISEEETQRREDIRAKVSTLQSDITARRANIDALNSDRERLLWERSTATAERIWEIERELSEIPTKIAALEAEILTLEWTLSTAKQEAAEVSVLEWRVLTENILAYLSGSLESAIQIQWAIEAITRNIESIKNFKNQIQILEESIALAPTSSEKNEISRNIENINALYAQLQTRLDQDIAARTNIATISWFDFENVESKASLERLLSLTENTQIWEVFSLTNGDNINEAYKNELISQIWVIENSFVNPENKNIENLKSIVAKRAQLTAIYWELFWESYDEARFQEIINSKKTSLLLLPYNQIFLRENIGVENVVNRYFSQLSPENKSVIQIEFSTQNTLWNILTLLEAFSQAQAYRLADNTEVVIDETTRTESRELSTVLQWEINFLS